MVYIRISEKTAQAKALLEMLKTFPFVEVLTEKIPNEITLKAMKEAKEGKVIKAKTVNEMLKKLKG